MSGTRSKDKASNSIDWTTGLIIQIVAEHRFGWIGHSLVGLIAGALSGCLLHAIVLTVVTGSGSANEVRFVEAAVIEAAAGAVVGAIAMAGVGLAISGTAAKT